MEPWSWMTKYETTHNKRAGIFYGAATGHPIIWNNDWHSLIQKEVTPSGNYFFRYIPINPKPKPF